MKYANEEHTVIQDGNRSIPVNPDNRDYQHILERVSAGETIDDYIPLEESYIDKRVKSLSDGGYGTIKEQLEMIGELGMTDFKNHIKSVKTRHPKK